MSAAHTPSTPGEPDRQARIRRRPEHPPEQATTQTRRIELPEPPCALRKPIPIVDGRRPATTREALEVHSYLLRAFHARPDLAARADRLLHTVLRRRLDTEHAEPPTDRLRVDRIA